MTRVDAVILGWIMETNAPLKTLSFIQARMREMSGRQGHILTADAMGGASGKTPGLRHVRISSLGTLTGHVEDVACHPAMSWDAGELRLRVSQIELPCTVIASLIGRRVGEIVSHRWIPSGAIITGVDELDEWLRLECQEFSIPIEEARRIMSGSGPERRGEEGR